VKDATDLLTLAGAESDADLAQAVTADTAELNERIETMELELAFSGEYDRRPAILAIHAGAGGTDAQDWECCCGYLRWADKLVRISVLDIMPGEKPINRPVRSSENAYGAWQRRGAPLVRISPYDSRNRDTAFALAGCGGGATRSRSAGRAAHRYVQLAAQGQNAQNDNAVRIPTSQWHRGDLQTNAAIKEQEQGVAVLYRAYWSVKRGEWSRKERKYRHVSALKGSVLRTSADGGDPNHR
jgi:hypothetical protein